MARTQEDSTALEAISVEEFARRVQRGRDLLAQLEALFPGTISLTHEERTHAERLRAGESEILDRILDAAECAPQYFTSLADKDDGHDPHSFETRLLRERLRRRDLLNEVVEAMEPVRARLNDTVLHIGSRVRPVALAAYQIGKSLSSTDDRLRARLAPAIDFYSGPARRGAATRRRPEG